MGISPSASVRGVPPVDAPPDMDLNWTTDKKLFEMVASASEDKDKAIFDSAGIKINPGDMLEFDRGDTHYHSALYIKSGMVLHVTQLPSHKFIVLMQSLEGVRHGSKVYVRNRDERAKQEFSAQPRIFNDIVKAAATDMGMQIDYNPLTNNCEHHCTNWRYGVSFNTQTEPGKRIGIGGISVTVGSPSIFRSLRVGFMKPKAQ